MHGERAEWCVDYILEFTFLSFLSACVCVVLGFHGQLRDIRGTAVYLSLKSFFFGARLLACQHILYVKRKLIDCTIVITSCLSIEYNQCQFAIYIYSFSCSYVNLIANRAKIL